jgi:hypothetical protein
MCSIRSTDRHSPRSLFYGIDLGGPAAWVMRPDLAMLIGGQQTRQPHQAAFTYFDRAGCFFTATMPISRSSFFLASLRARRTLSAFSRARLTDGFS